VSTVKEPEVPAERRSDGVDVLPAHTPANRRGHERVLLFRKGDKVVHPRHGATVVEDLLELEMFGKRAIYLKLCLPYGLTIMVPVDSAEEVGLRGVVSIEEVSKVFDTLQAGDDRLPIAWTQRYKTYLAKLTSGDIHQVSEVVRDLSLREREKALSAADKRMLAKGREILISELTFAFDSTMEHVETMLDHVLDECRYA